MMDGKYCNLSCIVLVVLVIKINDKYIMEVIKFVVNKLVIIGDELNYLY